jgi:hypothetical protein
MENEGDNKGGLPDVGGPGSRTPVEDKEPRTIAKPVEGRVPGRTIVVLDVSPRRVIGGLFLLILLLAAAPSYYYGRKIYYESLYRQAKALVDEDFGALAAELLHPHRPVSAVASF